MVEGVRHDSKTFSALSELRPRRVLSRLACSRYKRGCPLGRAMHSGFFPAHRPRPVPAGRANDRERRGGARSKDRPPRSNGGARAAPPSPVRSRCNSAVPPAHIHPARHSPAPRRPPSSHRAPRASSRHRAGRGSAWRGYPESRSSRYDGPAEARGTRSGAARLPPRRPRSSRVMRFQPDGDRRRHDRFSPVCRAVTSPVAARDAAIVGGCRRSTAISATIA
jgi:hypothetical protein